MTRLDSNAAWKEASALVAANRDVLLAVAGVFVLLPSLILAVIAGEPAVEPGMTAAEMQAAMRDFYASNWPLILISGVLQIVGILTLLTLMRDRSRPTVAQAIGAGARGTPSYLAAQLLLGLGVGIGGGLLLTLAGAISGGLALLALFGVIALLLYFAVRLVLVAPIVAVESELNPVAAMRRSWTLTHGNFWRIFAFLALLAILCLIVAAIIMLIVGTILALLTSGETQRVVAAVFSSAVGAIVVVYFVAVVAAIHRQLGGSPRGDSAPVFD